MEANTYIRKTELAERESRDSVEIELSKGKPGMKKHNRLPGNYLTTDYARCNLKQAIFQTFKSKGNPVVGRSEWND